MDPSMLAIRARMGANARIAKHGAIEATRPMRQAATTALNAKLIEQYSLDSAAPDFDQRLKAARSSHYGRLALKAAATRARKRERVEVAR